MCCGYFRSVIGALVGGAVAVAAAPVVLTAAGFAGGVTAGSAAASLMSLYGGAVPAGSVVAALQSAGAAGLGIASKAAVASAGAYVGANAGADAKKRKAENSVLECQPSNCC